MSISEKSERFFLNLGTNPPIEFNTQDGRLNFDLTGTILA